MARKSQFHDFTLKKGNMIFLVTFRIGVYRRMKVAGPATRRRSGGFCYTFMTEILDWDFFWIETFLKSQRRFSLFKEENYIDKAIKHFPTDEV